MSNFWRSYALYPARLLCPWDSPDKNTGVIAIVFSRVCCWPRNQTHVPMSPTLAGRFFTTSATWEAKLLAYILLNDLIVEFNFTWMQCFLKHFLFKHPILYVWNYVLWKWSESISCSVVSDFFRLHGLISPTGSSVHVPGKNTAVGWHFLLQEIFPIQGWNLCLLHCRQILYHLSHQGVFIV